MKKSILIICLFLFGDKIFSQGFVHNVPLIPQGFSITLLNGYGSSGLLNNVSNIGSMNPAALEIFNKNDLGVSYQFESKLKDSWIADIGSVKINKVIPQSVGFVYPINSIRLSLSMHQRYNRSLLFGPIEKTTVEYPDGTGEFIDVKYKTMIYSYSFTATYIAKNFTPNSDLSIGLRIGLNNLHEYNRIEKIVLDASVYAPDIAIGVIYSIKRDIDQVLKFGLFYESDISFSKSIKYNINASPRIADTNRAFFYVIDNKFKIAGKLPQKLRFDFDISAKHNLRFMGSISNIFWSSIDENYKNQIELSGSITYFFNKLFTPSVGFFYNDRKYNEDYFKINQNIDAIFLTVGTVTKYKNLKIHFTLADSHMFSGDWRKQTIFQSIISYCF